MTNIHLLAPGTERSDEYGTWADVMCGAVGSYYSAVPAETTCSRCIVATLPIPSDVLS
jgi:hypothetical protein